MIQILAVWWETFLSGLLMVLRVSAVSLVIAVACGLAGASARLSQRRLPQALAKAYTVVFRGTPELVLLLLFYFGLAITLTQVARLFDPSVRFIDMPPFWAGSVTIGLIVGAYMTETFRGAFLGVDRGQTEAALALGLRRSHVFWHVRVPQMWRLALPNFGNHMLSIMKDTALVSIIGLEELLGAARIVNASVKQPFMLYMIAALIYLGITTVITIVVARLEAHANRHLRRA